MCVEARSHAVGVSTRRRQDVVVVVILFVRMRVRRTLGDNFAVIAEGIVRSIETVEVATISVNLYSILACPADRLVYKVPNKATLQVGVLTNQIPVLLESTYRVAHGMSVLALDKRLGSIGALAIIFHEVVVGIHGAKHIGKLVAVCLLVLHHAALLFILNPVVALLKVGSDARATYVPN